MRLRGEQGPGDTLFFLRFAPLLGGIARGLVLDVDPRIAALMEGPDLFSARHDESGEGLTLQRQPGAAPFKRIAPDRLGAMLRGMRATLVSIQRSPRPADAASFERSLGRPVADLSRVNGDLRDALAAVSLLDDYVGVSNTNFHLRASLGRAARVLVTQPAEWRWMKAGEASPSFPGFALYRQAMDGGWEKALARLEADLRERWVG